ncbi:PHP domain-containing protein [Desulfovibrio sp. OttesenSCG-928-I05]|nr:PHP domain-containing protein [Desulfovibrio sp. OttesenSCG-928-I05]
MALRVDLHTHSCASDGTDSPGELVRLAAATGLAAVALTDHDTLGGLDEATEAGKHYGVELIRGCEVASDSPYGEVHIVGLWIPEKAPALEAALREIRDGRASRNERMVQKLQEHGIGISMDDVQREAGGETIARPHIARALVAGGYVKNVQTAFATLIGEGCPMYVGREIPTPSRALAMLRDEGAVTVLAHPMLIKAPPEWLDGLVRNLAAEGLNALEAWHSEHDTAATRTVVTLADRHGLALSGGSDYHGWVKPTIKIGTGKGSLRIPYSVMERLHALRREPAHAFGASHSG